MAARPALLPSMDGVMPCEGRSRERPPSRQLLHALPYLPPSMAVAWRSRRVATPEYSCYYLPRHLKVPRHVLQAGKAVRFSVHFRIRARGLLAAVAADRPDPVLAVRRRRLAGGRTHLSENARAALQGGDGG